MVRGKWISIKLPNHRPQMQKHAAATYYNAKIREIWHALLEKEFPCEQKREQIIHHVSTKSVQYIRYCHSLRKK